MRYFFTPIGTEGDVRPVVAVAKGLRDAGHDVVIASSKGFKPLLDRADLPFVDLGFDTQAFMKANPRMAGGGAMSALKPMISVAMVVLNRQVRCLLANAKGYDCIIGNGVTFGGTIAAEKLGIPYRHAVHVPQVLPSRFHPPLTIAAQRLPRFINALLWKMSMAGLSLIFRPTMNEERRLAGLQPLKDVAGLLTSNMVIAMDPVVAPVPPDVTAKYDTTAYWPHDDAATISKELNEYLDNGDPPIYVGFGSMTDENPARTLEYVEQASRACGVRILVAGGWAEMGKGRNSDSVFFISHVPHRLVLPRVAAAIHHGGAGTTWSVARAGVPQAAIPHLLDQHFWAERIVRMGVGVRCCSKNRITARRIARVMRDLVSTTEYRTRAKEISQQIAQRNGVAEAVSLFEKVAADGGASAHKNT